MTSDTDATRVDSRVGAGADVTPHVVIGATSETPGVSDVASLIASVVIDSGDGDADRWTSTEKRSRRSIICSGAMNGSTICAMNIRAITRLKRGVTVGVAGAQYKMGTRDESSDGRALRAFFLSNVSVFTELWRE